MWLNTQIIALPKQLKTLIPCLYDISYFSSQALHISLSEANRSKNILFGLPAFNGWYDHEFPETKVDQKEIVTDYHVIGRIDRRTLTIGHESLHSWYRKYHPGKFLKHLFYKLFGALSNSITRWIFGWICIPFVLKTFVNPLLYGSLKNGKKTNPDPPVG